jgi:hypothetical protein
VTGADAEPQPARGQIVDGDRLRGQRDGMARIGGRHRGAEPDAAGGSPGGGEGGDGIGGRPADRCPGGGDAAALRLLDAGDKIRRAAARYH